MGRENSIKKYLKAALSVAAALLIAVFYFMFGGGDRSADNASVIKGESYTSKSEVALYLHTYGELPENYITKNEAKSLGWDSGKGNLDEVAPGKSIGGDRYGNYEKKLPDGEKYRECDIDYEGGYRGGKRLVYSYNGSIYYTNDHYNSFEKLY